MNVVKELHSQGELVQRERDPIRLRLWLFSHDGLTEKAEVFARENGIYWSAREEFDELLSYVGLRRLPEVG